MSQRYLGGIITANPTAPTLSSASGVWTLEQYFQYSQTIQPEIIGNSLRFRSSASAYLNRTPASAGNRTTMTFSWWVKLGALNTTERLFSANASGTDDFTIYMSSDQLTVYNALATVMNTTVTTSQVFRDPSAWYHIAVSIDTTQATSSNRIKVYINGTQVTAFGTATYPAQNTQMYWNTATVHAIGRNNGAASQYFDGYMAEVYFVDGQALTPSSFGAYDSNGVWQPLAYTGTYGTNGFYLDFSNNTSTATLGNDYSGNNNTFTTNNFSLTAGSTYDWMLDSPTNSDNGGTGRGNYAVGSPVASDTTATSPSGLTDGNLAWRVDNTRTIVCSMGMSSGKWYWEHTITAIITNIRVGIVSTNRNFAANNVNPSSYSDGYTYISNGNKENNNSATAYGASYTVNDVIGIAFDADAGTLTFYKNNVSQGVAFSGVSGTFVACAYGTGVGSTGCVVNFGQRPFTYTPPTGFKALNTQNLPTPTIVNGAKYMAATLWSGNTSTQVISNAVNGVSFQPDFVWMKARSINYDNTLQDSVRGTSAYLFSNSTAAEGTAANLITSFNSNGFTMGNSGNINQTGQTYVGWQWQAGVGTTSSNTSGTITSTVCAGATQGFSVVTYSGTGANATVGHGLGVAPSMIIAKHRNAVDNWIVYHTSLGGSPNYLWLNLTSAAGTSSAVWNTFPTSSVFGVGTDNLTNLSGGTYVAYCFAAVKGYSAFGSYTGNGSTDGSFVYLGFRPRWVMIKNSGVSGDWWVVDTSRSTTNVATAWLNPNTSSAESSAISIDLLSNGFKLRSAAGNDNGQNWIYAAFAENPFNIARAR